ncbi:MAG: UvrD-helicase domain-containing protein [Bacteroidales bacterium]|nr:UvrD-helicase domain-containing protein [Bacteroidales bacterium]MBR5018902.1 UvrD-helicase domain-containing protein [Bacteroidales bacterium]
MNNSQTDLFEGLNSAQKAAVLCTEGPSLIIAGAGSGKTRVLTCRVAHILEGDCRPGEVMALTFTKKAAGEMKERVAALVGERKARWIQMGTFHSIFIRFLREYADRLGYPAQFTIYDQTDSRSVIKQCVKELGLDDKNYKPAVVQSIISMAKNSLVTVGAYRTDVETMERDRAARRPRLADVYELYQKKCLAAGAMDFDDILLQMNILLKKFPDACAEIASRFRYILVDEYQDTNHAQYVILRRLAEPHHNLCVVGDDSQSIYGFRGARIENILRFKRDYPEAKEFRLEQNYRSTQTIVEAANSLIAHNERRLRKECFSRAGAGEKIGVIKAYTDSEEAHLVASSIIERIYSTKASYDSFAILYRTNAQSRAFEEALRKRNLPYRIYGGHSFYERAEIKDMLAYFKLAVNPQDNESFRRIINVPARGIGDTTLDRLAAAAAAAGCPLYNAPLLKNEKLYAVGLKDAAIKKLRDFVVMMEPLCERTEHTDCYELAVKIGTATGYLLSLKADNSPEGLGRFENVEELFNSIKAYSEEEAEMRKILAEDGEEAVDTTVTLGDYLENIYLLSEAEKDDTQDPDREQTNKIVLMTVHAAKGLEFPYVYIAGMEENLFPSEMMNDTPDKIEEERRLFYVALTRAQKAVTVSYAQNRRKWGSEDSTRPSRFLREIDRKYYAVAPDTDANRYDPFPQTRFRASDFQTYRQPQEQRPWQRPSAASRTQPAATTQQPVRPTPPPPAHTPSVGFAPSPVAALQIGQRVEHDRFGYGTILSLEGEAPNRKAVVAFDTSGQKTLLLKFAKLRIV